MSEYSFVTMIIPADVSATARELALQVAGEPAEGMWQVGLSPTGELPATHYISSGAVYKEFYPLLTDADALSNATGIDIDQARHLVSSCDVSFVSWLSPHDRIAQLGLSIIDDENMV